MEFVEIASVDALRGHLAWPWITVDASKTRFAFVSAEDRIATRVLSEDTVSEGPSFVLPTDLRLPSKRAPAVGHRGVEAGIHGFSIDHLGTHCAITGTVESASVIVTIGADGERIRSRIDALASGDFTAHAVAFDRSGARLWISAESADETALILIDAASHAVFGVVRSPPFPPPSSHELHLHLQDDAVLLLAACGQDGTFARIAGWSDGPPINLTTALDGGSEPAGFVGFSVDGARVHLVESAELRTHAWPGLEELSKVPLAADFVSSYAGVVLGQNIYIDGQDEETEEEDSVMLFDRSAIRGALLKPPFPTGMWVGRLGANTILTVASTGDPARGSVLRLRVPTN